MHVVTTLAERSFDENNRPANNARQTKADITAQEKKAFSLLGEQGEGGRKWSDAYPTLSRHGMSNRVVNWLISQSIPPMLPPYHAGSAKSDLMIMLKAGHGNVKLSSEKLDKIAGWCRIAETTWRPMCGPASISTNTRTSSRSSAAWRISKP